ncbi:hypothetical protein J6590_069005 [Homalodisca vitripennis]|nr:hypothetical protein J6590_069005 [Homalodisca vitripennis]
MEHDNIRSNNFEIPILKSYIMEYRLLVGGDVTPSATTGITTTTNLFPYIFLVNLEGRRPIPQPYSSCQPGSSAKSL